MLFDSYVLNADALGGAEMLLYLALTLQAL